MSMTMSISSAPWATDSAASAALTSAWCLPLGNPQTTATFSPSGTSTGRNDGERHTL